MTNTWSDISKPTFVINKQRAINNISQMAEKFNKSNTIFRPHFKTHQSLEVANWFRKLGINKISVSSVDMALQFYNAGWKDISIVFPFNQREIHALNIISKEAKINILVEDINTIEYLSKHNANSLGVFIKIDCGYNRTGIDVANYQEIRLLAQAIKKSPSLHLKGILSHFGNTYSARSRAEVMTIFNSGMQKMQNLKQALSDEFPDLLISLGDTPSASLATDFSKVDEMRPGNFVFYDWMQVAIGSCETQQLAAIMLCPIVAKHEDRNELIIHGGAVHFSKEKGDHHFGAITDISKGFSSLPIEGVSIKSLSQEHGIIKCNDAFFQKTKLGDLVGVIPIHSCLTANLMQQNTLIY